MLGGPSGAVNACPRVYTRGVTMRDDVRGRATWMAIAAVLALVAGLLLAMSQAGLLRRFTAGRPLPGDAVIDQALRQAPAAPDSGDGEPVGVPEGHPPIDSTAYKHRWLDEVRTFDLTALPARERDLFVRFANARECTCGCGYSLAGCRASDMTCEVSGAELAALLDSIRTGAITHARGIRARPR